jgi:hypothetical protein
MRLIIPPHCSFLHHHEDAKHKFQIVDGDVIRLATSAAEPTHPPPTPLKSVFALYRTRVLPQWHSQSFGRRWGSLPYPIQPNPTHPRRKHMLLTMESKTAAAHKLELLSERGRAKAGEVLDHVMNNQPTDRIAQGGELVFTPSTDGSTVQIQYTDPRAGKIDQRLHRHATLQMAQTLDLPVKFIDSLQTTPKPWAQELLAHNLSTVFANRFSSRRYLLRSVSGEVRGFLSDRYRRLDSRPIIDAFAKAVQAKGAVPYEGYVTDTKIALQAIMPQGV